MTLVEALKADLKKCDKALDRLKLRRKQTILMLNKAKKHEKTGEL